MYKIGVDLGGTNIVAGIVDEEHHVLGKSKTPTLRERPCDEVLADIKKVIELAVTESKVDWSEISSIGIGTPGTVNRKDGIIEYANNLNFNNVHIREFIESAYHLPVYVDNDANCAALGEAVAGAGNGVDDFVAITLGTGVGSGIVVDGKIVHGCNDAAGEIGHMVIKFGGERCTCGRRGCWEAYASATALIRQTQDIMGKKFDSVMWEMVGGDIKKVTGHTPFDAMREGDAAAREVVNNYTYYLAVGIVNIINIFQPKVLCIGGGIGNEGESLLTPVRYYVNNEHYSMMSQNQTVICSAVLGNDAGIIGAALLEEQN